MTRNEIGRDYHVRMMKRGAEMIGKMLGPNDDWTPVVAYTDGDGNPHVIDSFPLATREREIAAWRIATHLRADHAVAVAVVGNMMTMRDLDAVTVLGVLEGDIVRPRDNPNAIEVVQVAGYDLLGEEVWSADVDRSGDHPNLGEWTRSGFTVQGPMVDPFLYAIGRPTGASLTEIENRLREMVGA